MSAKPDGILIVDKPKNWTSHDVVAKLRNVLNQRQIGHGGTLDPTATGVLIILIGSATKKSDEIVGLDKTYLIDFMLGQSTTTGDETGEVSESVSSARTSQITQDELRSVLANLQGELIQIAPWFSAIKVGGTKLYQMARGKTAEELSTLDQKIVRPQRTIVIHTIELLKFSPGSPKKYPTGQIQISCSSGTYTRAFVERIGQELGVPAHQTALRRLRIGPFDLKNAVTQDRFEDRDYLLQQILVSSE